MGLSMSFLAVHGCFRTGLANGETVNCLFIAVQKNKTTGKCLGIKMISKSVKIVKQSFEELTVKPRYVTKELNLCS